MYYIITRENCRYCDKAKALLKERGDSYEAYLYTDHPMIKKLMIRAGLDTVPQIWYNGSYVGGYSDLVEYVKHQDVQDVEETQ